jgi:hypothetical protein
MPMPIRPLDPRQEPIERGHQVVVRPRPDLDDDQTGRRVRHEDGQEAIAAVADLGEETTRTRR